jgi:dCTP deaminase
MTIAFGKSTYARCGVIVNITPFEPEWEGYATLAISNLGPAPVRVYAGEGIGQLIFLEASEICAVSYRDKDGKYQAQSEITTAIV